MAFAQTIVVDPNGSDSAGSGTIAAPYKTIAKGLAVASSRAPTTSNRICVLAMPGQYAETTDLKLPRWTWLCGLNQGMHARFTIVSSTGAIGIDSQNWNPVNDGDQGGFANIRFASAVTVTGPQAPNGQDVVVDFTFCRFNTDVSWTYFSSGADIEFFLCIHEGNLTGTHGAFYSNQSNFNNCTVAMGGTAEHINSTFGNVTLTQASGITGGDPMFFVACNMNALSVSGTGAVVSADSISLPPAASITLAGGAALQNLGDCSSLTYTPAVAGNWASTPPATVQAALDRIAAKTPGA